MAQKEKEYKKEIQHVDRIQRKLNAKDFIHLYFMQNAPSLSVSENQQLYDQLKNTGRLETYAIYFNSMFTAVVIFIVLWAYNDNFNHAKWILPLFVLLVVPILGISYFQVETSHNRLTYKKYAICQFLSLPCAILAWGILGLQLAPINGVSVPISLGIILVTTVYAIIWFKTLPLATLLWTVLFGSLMFHVYSGETSLFTGPDNFFAWSDGSPQISKIFIFMLYLGTNGIAIYLFCAEVISQFNSILANKYLAVNQLLIDTFEKSSKDFLWQANDMGKITYASPKFKNILRAQTDHKVIVDDHVLLHADEQLSASIEGHVQAGISFEFVFTNIESDGSVAYWSIEGDPLYDEHGVKIGFSGFGTDVTALQYAEKRKNQVDNYKAMTRMASMIGHDFNNYLATIVACLDLIHHKPDDREAVDRHLILVSDAVSAAENMTTQLLDLEKNEREKVIKINIFKALEQVINETRAVYPIGLEINLNIPDDTYIHANLSQFSRSVRNVLENSAQAMNAAGIIDIGVETLKANSAKVRKYLPRKCVVKGGDYVVLSFSDNGPGFNENQLGTVFEPFKTSKSRRHSRGLGLAMVENFCLNINGYVSARNGDNGAIIELVLPKSLGANLTSSVSEEIMKLTRIGGQG